MLRRLIRDRLFAFHEPASARALRLLLTLALLLAWGLTLLG